MEGYAKKIWQGFLVLIILIFIVYDILVIVTAFEDVPGLSNVPLHVRLILSLVVAPIVWVGAGCLLNKTYSDKIIIADIKPIAAI